MGGRGLIQVLTDATSPPSPRTGPTNHHHNNNKAASTRAAATEAAAAAGVSYTNPPPPPPPKKRMPRPAAADDALPPFPHPSSTTTTGGGCVARARRHLRGFQPMFWVLSVCCLVVYGTILPFNNIASSLLQVRLFVRACLLLPAGLRACVPCLLFAPLLSKHPHFTPNAPQNTHIVPATPTPPHPSPPIPGARILTLYTNSPPNKNQERDYFKPIPDGCGLLNETQCQSATNPPVGCPDSPWCVRACVCEQTD